MVLVAASALAFLILRPVAGGWLRSEPRWTTVLAGTISLLMTWTPTLLILHLRRPRRPRLMLARSPGFAACLAGTSVIALALLALAVLLVIRQFTAVGPSASGLRSSMAFSQWPWWVGVVVQFGPLVGPAVIATWLFLAASGRRRPSGDWLDGLGRVVGAAWIAIFVINSCSRLSYLMR
jgi:hypothetical protein